MTNTLYPVTLPGGAGTGTANITFALDAASAVLPVTVEIMHSRGAYPVRGWDQRIVGTAGQYMAIDHEAPLNEQLTVSLRVGTNAAISRTFTVPSNVPILSDPISGEGVHVTIQAWPEMAYERRGNTITISDSVWPVIIDGQEQAPSSTLTLLHNLVPSSAGDLERILSRGSVLRVRPSCPGMPAAWVSARGRRRGLFSRRPDSATVDVIELLHTAMPSPDVGAIGSTLQDLANMYPGTLGDIAGDFYLTTLWNIATLDYA